MPRPPLLEALAALEIDSLSCAIHERCFPPDETLDPGCGTVGGSGARDFLGFLRELGFTDVQLGPAGEISPHNLSPYDGTAFARSRLLLSWESLPDALRPKAPPQPPSSRDTCDFERAFAVSDARWEALHARWDPSLQPAVDAFARREASWLEPEVFHRALSARHGTPDATRWPEDGQLYVGSTPAQLQRLASLRVTYAEALARFAREQWLLEAQYLAMREAANQQGLRLWADLQVGLAHGDRWARAGLMFDEYAMGAPPSRTNPEGQPWGYPVLRPDHPGARAFVSERFARLFRLYDGVRVDHPHGLVCPWLYRRDAVDPLAAVQAGARLFSVGPRPEHAALAAFDLVRAEQLQLERSPWAEDFVTALEPAQVIAYARTLDALLDAARTAGRDARSISCEVLSSLPRPLAAVLQRHGLGRFRVTQKADVTKPDDVYLPANAEPADWMMVGTHDTPTVWRTAAQWSPEVVHHRVQHAVSRLAPDGVGAEALTQAFSASRAALAAAELALLFTTRARHVMLWVFDLLGDTALYNRPGVITPENWAARVVPDFRARHQARMRQLQAFDPAWCLALALAARPFEERQTSRALLRELEASAASPVPGLRERLAAS